MFGHPSSRWSIDLMCAPVGEARVDRQESARPDRGERAQPWLAFAVNSCSRRIMSRMRAVFERFKSASTSQSKVGALSGTSAAPGASETLRRGRVNRRVSTLAGLVTARQQSGPK